MVRFMQGPLMTNAPSSLGDYLTSLDTRRETNQSIPTNSFRLQSPSPR